MVLALNLFDAPGISSDEISRKFHRLTTYNEKDCFDLKEIVFLLRRNFDWTNRDREDSKKESTEPPSTERFSSPTLLSDEGPIMSGSMKLATSLVGFFAVSLSLTGNAVDNSLFDSILPLFALINVGLLLMLLHVYIPQPHDWNLRHRLDLYWARFRELRREHWLSPKRSIQVLDHVRQVRVLWTRFVNPRALLPAIWFSFMISLMDFWTPEVDGKLLAGVLGSEERELRRLVALRMSLFGFLLSSHILHGIMFARARHFAAADAKEALFRKMISLDVLAFHRYRPGDLQLILENDCPRVVETAFRVVDALFCASFRAGMGGLGSLRVDPWMSCLSLAINVPFIFHVLPWSSNVTSSIYDYYEWCKKISHSFASETLGVRCTRTIRLFGAENEECSRYRVANAHFLEALKYFNLPETALVFNGTAIHWMLDTMMIIFGGIRISQGRMTPAEVITYRGRIQLLTQGLRDGASISTDLSRIKPILERILAISEEAPPCETSTNEPVDLGGDIEFDRVCWADPSDPSRMILEDLTFIIKKGQFVALAGPSGAGKSTILALLAGIYQPTKGVIRVNGVDLQKVPRAQLRQWAGFIEQEAILFNRSARENIALGCREASEQRIVSAANLAHAHEFIRALPLGYDTVLGEGGTKLSLGQRQRIGIARAVIRDPQILICDEPTSNLDAESEVQVHGALMELTRSRTMILVAHRLSTISSADMIIFIEGGRVREIGDHVSLLEKVQSRYSTFVNIQSGGGGSRST